MDLGINGKFALVTGGSHGIGRSIALALAAEGCNVAIIARGRPNIKLVVSELEARGVRALGIAADLVDRVELARSFEEVVTQFGGLHILVNNIGGGAAAGARKIQKKRRNVFGAKSWIRTCSRRFGLR